MTVRQLHAYAEYSGYLLKGISMLLSMQMKTTLVIIAITAAVVAILAVSSGKLFSHAYGCETNAKGCIEQGGPGQSGVAPPEVSGCHFFDIKQCVKESTPP